MTGPKPEKEQAIQTASHIVAFLREKLNPFANKAVIEKRLGVGKGAIAHCTFESWKGEHVRNVSIHVGRGHARFRKGKRTVDTRNHEVHYLYIKETSPEKIQTEALAFLTEIF